MPLRLTIIGAGPGGYVAAIRAAQLGARVTVIEDAEVGGTCLNRGCIPTKTLIASTDALRAARNAGDFGVVLAGEVSYSLQKINERKEKVVSTQVKGIRSLFKSNGITLIPGRGSFIDRDVVRAVQRDGTIQDIASDRVIIATGSRPAALSGLTIDHDTVLSSDDAVRLNEIPKTIAIVGAGVIGCEFAFLYRALGAEVTVIEAQGRALSSEDEDMSAIIEREMKKAKIRLVASAQVVSLEKESAGAVLRLSTGLEMRVERVLVSVGRAMNSGSIGLGEAGIEPGSRGEIPVNDRMETTAAGVYAVGDVTGKMLLAHVASRQGIVAVENAMGGNSTMDYGAVPAGIFTRPEIGSVGLREHQAVQQGRAVKIGRFPYRALGKAHAMGAIEGMVKVIADASDDRVLGVHICGAHAADLIHEGVLAIASGTTSSQLAGMIHAHPTLAEGIKESAEALHGRAIHLPKEES